ncbi:MAG: GPP34 family phosphoprotein [Gammaproteobacteria bacterium]|nr:GPP34 family phosphoprotein [Gammaproteobacteria bacterium]
MLTFTEEILLLMLDDDGVYRPIRGSAVEYILVGAVLMDLAFANRIDTDPDKLMVTDPTPTGNSLLDRTLERITNAGETMSTKVWMEVLAREQAADVRQQAMGTLIERGIVEAKDGSFRIFRSIRRYPTIDERIEREAKLRLKDVLLSDDTPDPRDVAMIGLLDACGILDAIFSEPEMERARPRIKQLRMMDLIGREVGGVVTDIEKSITMAMAQLTH